MTTSIVIPTYNEKDNIERLIHQIKLAAGLNDYEVIVVDDNSNDGTWQNLMRLQYHYPVKIRRKQGKKGKAYSLIEGFDHAKGEILAFIDGDLQYPPEEIFRMTSRLQSDADVVVAERSTYKESQLRQIKTAVFRQVFGKLMLGINHDVQSGLKVFKREVLETVKFKPKSPWTFDMEFLLRAKNAGFKIADHNIIFEKRRFGKSKVNSITATLQIALNALSLRFESIAPRNLLPKGVHMKWAGIGYKGKKNITHTTLAHKYSAVQTVYLWQKIFIFSILVFFYSLYWVIH